MVPHPEGLLTSLKLLPSNLREVARRRALAEVREELRRAGVRLASSGPAKVEGLDALREDVGRAAAALDAIAGERRAIGEAEARDLARVAWWVRPVVVVRACSARIVLQHDRCRAQRSLDRAHEALGRAAMLGNADIPRPPAPVGEGGPEWAGRAAREASGFAVAVWGQLRGHLFPKLPALAGMAVGWWIANTYTDSRLRSVLRSVGIGSGGTHVVSGSTYRAMTFWLPLLAAALCAYAGERIWERLAGREEQR
jgi:hypothetical protein